MMSPFSRLRTGTLAFVCLLAAGCAHVAPRLAPVSLPPGAPTVQQVLADLAAADSAINSFTASGAFTMESPEFNATKYFKDGVIVYRRPADLSVVARKLLGATVMRLTCVSDEFLIEFPATNDKPYYRLAGERYRNVPFSVSPSAIAREMFFPEPWTQLAPDEVRLTAYDAATQTATLEIGPARTPRRRVTVTGAPWSVTRNERLDDHGRPIAISTREDYRELGGTRFPYRIDAQFPTERTRMNFEMRQVTLNQPVDDALFDIKSRAREAGVADAAGL